MANSFFKKLKKGMGIELPVSEPEKLKKNKLPKKQIGESVVAAIKSKEKTKKETPVIAKKETPIVIEKIINKKTKIKIAKEVKSKKKPSKKKPQKDGTKEIFKTENAEIGNWEEKKDWMEAEGQLAIDVYQTEKELVIISAIAGIKSEEIDITIDGDLVTIKGRRGKPFMEKEDYFTQECYWGLFSREIILPTQVDPKKTMASMKNGILTIRIPKIIKDQRTVIRIKHSE